MLRLRFDRLRLELLRLPLDQLDPEERRLLELDQDDPGELLLERLPTSTSVLSSLASVYANLGQIGRAARHIETATDLEPRNPEVLRTRAEIAIAAQRPGIAVLAAETLIEIDGTSPVSWAILGRARYAEGKSREALDAVHEALRLAPGDPDLKLLLADVLHGARRVDEALRAVREVLADHPGHPGAADREERWRRE